MKHYKKHIDNFFKEKLGNYRETPPPEAWDELEARLDGLTPTAPGFSYRWLLHVAIISGLVFLSVSLGRKIVGSNTQESGLTALNAGTGTANSVTAAASQTPSGTLSSAAATSPSAAGSQVAPGTGAANNAGGNAIAPAPQTNGSKMALATGTNSGIANTKQVQRPTAVKRQLAGQNTPILNATIGEDNPSLGGEATNGRHSSNLSNPSPYNDANDNSSIQTASPNTTLSVVNDATKPAADKKQPANNQSTGTEQAKARRTRTQPSFPRFETGFKGGYEGGVGNDAANKFVVSPYLQYNLCSHLAVMTQPGVKYAVGPSKTLSTGTYYNANPEDLKVSAGQTIDHTYGTVTYHVTPYTFTQVHDSVVKSNKIGGSSVQFEIPLLLNYRLTRRLSVYGGVNFVYNKLTTITENTVTVKNIQRTAVVVDSTTGNPTQPNFGFSYSGSPISDYNKLVANKSGYELSTGYMIGFTYAYSKKWLFDALVEQSPAQKDVKAGYNINSPLSLPYFRLSIGYKITK